MGWDCLPVGCCLEQTTTMAGGPGRCLRWVEAGLAGLEVEDGPGSCCVVSRHLILARQQLCVLDLGCVVDAGSAVVVEADKLYLLLAACRWHPTLTATGLGR
jgi:hypothetical protein